MTTAFKRVANRATGNLNASIDNAVTSVVLQAGQGALFPAFPGNDYLVTCDNERMLVTGRTTDTLTVTRGADGTAPAAHSSAAAVELRVVAAHLQDVAVAVNELELVEHVRQLHTQHYGNAHAKVASAALTNTVGRVGIFTNPTPFRLKKIVYNVEVAGSADAVVRLALYRAGGPFNLPETDITDAVGTATGVRVVTLPSLFFLAPGQYYIFITLSSGTTGPTVSMWQSSTGVTLFRDVNATDDRVQEGTVVVTAGAAPNPLGTITGAADSTLIAELVLQP